LRRAAPLAALILVLFVLPAGSALQTLESVARAFVSKPTPANRSALAAFAKAHSRDTDGALALLALAVTDLENGRAAEALHTLTGLDRRLPRLADYVAHFTARALVDLDRKDEACTHLDTVIGATPVSPLRPAAVMMLAALRETELAPLAPLLRTRLPELPQPKGLSLYAGALEAAGELTSAALQYQRLFHDYPLSPESAVAGEAILRLRQSLGDAYPPAMPDAMLRRASRLIDGGQTKRATEELTAMIPNLAGDDRDLARVRIGVAHYAAGKNLEALQYLESLSMPANEANAERLYHYLAAARRLDRVDRMHAAIDALARHHAASPWRLEALVSAGNYFLLDNKVEEYEPVYAACAEAAPGVQRGAYCHWKVVWAHYLARKPDAEALLRDHLRVFPASSNAPTALYFLGRLAEDGKDYPSAKAFYELILGRFPGYFYATQARDRLAGAHVAAALSSAKTLEFLRSIEFPERGVSTSFEADAPTRLRLERARLLVSAALDPWAEPELRFAARNDARPEAVAIELARISTRRGAPEQALRYVKSLAPAYLNWKLADAPDEFWRFAYPVPYQEAIERYSRERNLDPFLMAGLIRQESEFNPRAVSRANAIGLTQVRPATGRFLSRRLRLPYTTSKLYLPDFNVQLGTFHLREMIDSLAGDLPAALAAYNAGKSRADRWLTWGQFREPAEFIETIPFTETREYVQTVLRNADMYRRIYSTPGRAARPASPASGAVGTSTAATRR
jgi:soluble lytic murein transglycosylase